MFKERLVSADKPFLLAHISKGCQSFVKNVNIKYF